MAAPGGVRLEFERKKKKKKRKKRPFGINIHGTTKVS